MCSTGNVRSRNWTIDFVDARNTQGTRVREARTRRPLCRRRKLPATGDPPVLRRSQCANAVASATTADTFHISSGRRPQRCELPHSEESVLRCVRMALSGVARTQGRVGKGLVAKMLCGSHSQQLRKLRLDQLSTFGLLSHLSQPEANALLDALIAANLIEQTETQRFRPTVKLTSRGRQVMKGQLQLDRPLSMVRRAAQTAGMPRSRTSRRPRRARERCRCQRQHRARSRRVPVQGGSTDRRASRIGRATRLLLDVARHRRRVFARRMCADSTAGSGRTGSASLAGRGGGISVRAVDVFTPGRTAATGLAAGARTMAKWPQWTVAPRRSSRPISRRCFSSVRTVIRSALTDGCIAFRRCMGYNWRACGRRPGRGRHNTLSGNGLSASPCATVSGELCRICSPGRGGSRPTAQVVASTGTVGRTLMENSSRDKPKPGGRLESGDPPPRPQCLGAAGHLRGDGGGGVGPAGPAPVDDPLFVLPGADRARTTWPTCSWATRRRTGCSGNPRLSRTGYDRHGKLIKGDPKKKLNKHFRVVLAARWRIARQADGAAQRRRIHYENEAPSNALLMFYMLVLLVPLALFAFFWFSYRRTRDQMMGGGFLMGFSKSPAKRYEAVSQPVTFKDVAGLEGVKADLGGDRRVPAEPGAVPALGWACAQGRAAQRTAGHRQDVAGPRRGR